jgi:hypothetical protein
MALYIGREANVDDRRGVEIATMTKMNRRGWLASILAAFVGSKTKLPAATFERQTGAYFRSFKLGSSLIVDPNQHQNRIDFINPTNWSHQWINPPQGLRLTMTEANQLQLQQRQSQHQHQQS